MTNKVTINFNLFYMLMKNIIVANIDDTMIVTVDQNSSKAINS